MFATLDFVKGRENVYISFSYFKTYFSNAQKYFFYVRSLQSTTKSIADQYWSF